MDDLFVFLVLICDVVLILLFFLLLKDQTKNKAIYVIPIYCIVNLIVAGVAELRFLSGVKVLFSLFTLFEFILFSAFIYLEIRSQVFKKIIVGAGVFFALFLLIYNKTITERSIDSIPIGIEAILILIFCFYYLYEQLNRVQTTFIHKKYTFWIVFGMMLYLAGSVFIYIFANQVDKKTLDSFWFLTNVFYIIKNILFAVGLFTYLKQSKTNKDQNPQSAELRPYLN